ncbi:MAG: hypothetical protein ACRDGJ_03935 [Candidatus Limnocylindria bacterium]
MFARSREAVCRSGAVLVVLAALLAPAAVAGAEVETIHFTGSFTEPSTEPCSSAPGTATVSFRGVSHTTVAPNGSVHHTATVTGEVTFIPDAAGQPSYAGTFTARDGQNGQLGATIVSSAAFRQTLFGSDGSRIRSGGLFHVTVLGDGSVIVLLDRITLTCP